MPWYHDRGSSLVPSMSNQNQVSMNEILPGLWLGSLENARNRQQLLSKKITHILTINSRDLSDERIEGMEHLFLEADDDFNQDIIQYFQASNEFIERGIKTGGVLVHCFFGVSRSATLVIAYLMHKEKLSLKAAHAFVKEKRSIISPNEIFVSQLKMYERMNNRIDDENALLRNFRLFHVAKSVQDSGSLADAPKKINFAPTPTSSGKEVTYRCKKCRKTLLREGTLMHHGKPSRDAEGVDEDEVDFCTNELFTEPVEWMKQSILGTMEGKLYCPSCKAKVGSFSWHGKKCSCLAWVCPAFHVRSQAVDRILPRQTDATST